MTNPISSSRTSSLLALSAMALIACAAPQAVLAQDEGGLYVAEGRFSFEQAAGQGLASNPAGQRFFVLALPPNAAALTKLAPKSAAAVRDRVLAAGGVLMVCKRDVDSGAIDAATLVPGVAVVRGFPPRGSDVLPQGERYFPDEQRDQLPANNSTLTRLRNACS
jgi:hypothetical protein